MYKLVVYIPTSHLETVKNALFAKGAGRYANYDQCAWQVLGEGQFRPLPNSSPAIGSIGQQTRVAEYKVEMICQEEYLMAVLEELQRVHPYEEPAYQVWPVKTLADWRRDSEPAT